LRGKILFFIFFIFSSLTLLLWPIFSLSKRAEIIVSGSVEEQLSVRKVNQSIVVETNYKKGYWLVKGKKLIIVGKY
jgi:hypothetical protein